MPKRTRNVGLLPPESPKNGETHGEILLFSRVQYEFERPCVHQLGMNMFEKTAYINVYKYICVHPLEKICFIYIYVYIYTYNYVYTYKETILYIFVVLYSLWWLTH